MIFKKELLIKIKDQEKININNITRLNKENNNNGIHTIHARMYKDTLCSSIFRLYRKNKDKSSFCQVKLSFCKDFRSMS